MTRDETIKVIEDHLAANTPGFEPWMTVGAFEAATPLCGCLLMLEALGLVKYDGEGKE